MSRFRTSALQVIAAAFAAVLSVPAQVAPSAWAAQNLVVPDGPKQGETFNAALTPYLVEPLDFFSDECPDNKCSIRKSAQTGFSLMAICAAGVFLVNKPEPKPEVSPGS